MKTGFKRLVCSMLMVLMLISVIPSSLVSAAADSIDWDYYKDKYGLTDEQIEQAKDVADKYDIDQEQMDAIEDYWESLDEEEKEAIKDSVADGTLDDSVVEDYVAAVGGAVVKNAIKEIVDSVLAELEGVVVPNPFDLNRVYGEDGSLEFVEFVLQPAEDANLLELIKTLVNEYQVYGALALAAPALLVADKISVNGYTVYDLTDPSTAWNALVDVYNANPVSFSAIANLEGNVIAEYNVSLSFKDITVDLPIRFVLNCSDATMNRIKATAQKLDDLIDVDASVGAGDGIYSAEIDTRVDLTDYLDQILEFVLPEMVADDYFTIREKLHAMTVSQFLDELTLDNIGAAAAKLGREAQFEKLVNDIATYFKVDVTAYGNVDAVVARLDESRLFQTYLKARLQKLYSLADANRLLNTPIGYLYNGDGSYTSVLGDGVDPVGFDTYADRALDRLMNTQIDEKLSNALAIFGFEDVQHYVDAIKNKYDSIYTGKYDLDLYFTLVLFDVYTVTFVDENGNVIEVQQVVAGDGAIDPDWHGGWDYYDFDVDYDVVMSDLTVVLTPLHELDDGVQTKDPTCQEKGEIVYSCTIPGCDYTESEAVDTVDHDMVLDSHLDETCDADGYDKYVCSFGCGYTETDVIPAHGHNMVIFAHADPDCESQGYTVYICQYFCGEIDIDYTDALGHEWDGGVVTTPATHLAAGVKTYTCSVCGETKTESIAPLGDHTYTPVYTDPTCTEDGYTTYTCACGASYTETDVGSALGHDWKSVQTAAPDCENEGEYEFVCTVCGETKVGGSIPALGHKWDDGVVTKDPSCCVEGVKTYTCSVCNGTKTEAVPVDPTLCVWDDGVVTKMPTCTETGVKLYTCTVCGETKTASVAALGHAWDLDNGDYYAATCTTDAYHVFTCSACGETETVVSTGTAGHSFDYTNGTYVAPTCKDEGTWTFECTECDETHVIVVDKLDEHSWCDFDLTKEPTCTEDGEVIYYCCYCDATYVIVIPATGEHIWSDATLTKEPTCTEDGELTYTCDYCDATKTEAVPAIGDHVWSDVHVDGTNCCNPTVDKKVCLICGDESNVVTTPVYAPTLKADAEDLHFVSNILVVSTNNLTVGEFKKFFETSITVYDQKGAVMKDSALVGTECTFVCDACDTEFSIAVIGDVNGDGKLNTMDYVLAKRHVMKTLVLEGAKLAAADVNVDCKVNVLDYALLKGHVMFLYNLYEKGPNWDEVDFLIVKFDSLAK